MRARPSPPQRRVLLRAPTTRQHAVRATRLSIEPSVPHRCRLARRTRSNASKRSAARPGQLSNRPDRLGETRCGSSTPAALSVAGKAPRLRIQPSPLASKTLLRPSRVRWAKPARARAGCCCSRSAKTTLLAFGMEGWRRANPSCGALPPRRGLRCSRSRKLRRWFLQRCASGKSPRGRRRCRPRLRRAGITLPAARLRCALPANLLRLGRLRVARSPSRARAWRALPRQAQQDV